MLTRYSLAQSHAKRSTEVLLRAKKIEHLHECIRGNNTCVVSLGRNLKLHDEFLDKKTDISLMDYIIAPFDGQWTKATIVCGFPKKKKDLLGCSIISRCMYETPTEFQALVKR